MQIVSFSKLAITVAAPLTMVGWLFSPASLADSSFSLKKLLSSVQTSSQSQKLINEISSSLRTNKIDAEQVQCIGTKLGKTYSSPTDAIAPFDCRFPNKLTIRINAQNFVILPSGRATPLENAKNFNSMPKPIYFSYKITSWNWKKTP
jgi:hypothetical protein